MTDQYDPFDPNQYDDMDPTTAVIAAWTAQWPDARWQMDCYREIREMAPALVRSLERLTAQALAPDDLGDEDASTELLEDVATDLVVEEPGEAEARIEQMETVELATIADPEPAAHTYRDHLILSESNVMALDEVWVEEEVNPDFTTMTVKELGARARRATERMRVWGRRTVYRESFARERALRDEIIVHLNNMDHVKQPQIAQMVGLSLNRVTMLIGFYYDRLEQS